MAVTLLFTGFTSHPKIVRAGLPAAWLFVCMLEYAAEWETNGFIPSTALRTFACKSDRKTIAKLLHQDDMFGPLLHVVENGYEVNDYLEWNRDAAELAAKRKAKSEAKSKAGKKGAAARWGGRLPKEATSTAMPPAIGLPLANDMANDMANDDPATPKTWHGDSPGSGSLVVTSLEDPPQLSNASHRRKTGDFHAAIRSARTRAASGSDPNLDGWDIAACRRVCGEAAKRWDVPASECYERLIVLASLDGTRSPGRLLEPTGWDTAGAELRRQRADHLRRTQEDAADQALRREQAATTAARSARAARIAHIRDTDPDGWEKALTAAHSALTAEAVAPISTLVDIRAIDCYNTMTTTTKGQP